MISTFRRLALRTAAAMVLCALVCTGCGSAPSLPAFTSSPNTYPLHIQFADVLNLPSGAPVMNNGVRVGRLTGMHIDDGGFVVADIEVDGDVQLPSDVTATLRQPAPLADVHIAILSNIASDAAALTPGATIPLDRTTKPPQIEDTLAGLATATGNGTISNFLTTVREVNRAFPDDTAHTARVFDTIGRNLEDLADHQDSVDSLLGGIDATARAVADESDILSTLLSEHGVQHTTESMTSVVGILFILTDLGQIAPPAQWLAPLLGSMNEVVSVALPALFGSSPADTGDPAVMSGLLDLVHDELIPFAESGAKIDITRVHLDGPSPTTISADEQADGIVQALRMLGLVR
ncbi:MlaD family protein [Rhodococcus artemisiae]|uniref:MlaD family protein n=1 Tax=Rhodococcus artemisiae TaxID=714159 RepID=A0ABU7LB54_9NOCA|nr:MlaD family protein [Rhodococcus artemisiae]MEE2058559.1 MlaD family protein [Rhodococcus artemisiae]